MANVNNPRHPDSCRIWREEVNDVFAGTLEVTEVYSGACRSYTKYQTSPSGEVITSTRMLSIPKKRGEWEIVPMSGDLVETFVGGHKEEGKVLDFMPNNFGTDVSWRYGRN